jgi:hypothetical protein
VVPDAGELVCDPPVLLPADVDPEEISAPDDEAADDCDVSEVADPPLAVLLPAEAELDDESDPDDEDPSDVGSAHATPCPAKTAAPTPRATASPPTRPIYRAAPIASPLSSGWYSTRDTVTRGMAVDTAMTTVWEVVPHMPCAVKRMTQGQTRFGNDAVRNDVTCQDKSPGSVPSLPMTGQTGVSGAAAAPQSTRYGAVRWGRE